MSRDDIGTRGQSLFYVLMTDFCGRDEPYFRPRFLGDKYPTFDYIVELVDYPAYYFFVQVKTTTLGYTAGSPPRLRIQVDQPDVDSMVACPAPAYVVGMDMVSGRGFLLSVNEARDRISSLTTNFELSHDVLRALGDEVRDFWTSRDMILVGSRFCE